MGLFWIFLFTIFLIYLAYILVTNVEDMDDWLKALYFLVITAGLATVGFLAREHFKNKMKNRTLENSKMAKEFVEYTAQQARELL